MPGTEYAILTSPKYGTAIPPIVSVHLKTARREQESRRAERKTDSPEDTVGDIKVVFVGISVAAFRRVGGFVKRVVLGYRSGVVHLDRRGFKLFGESLRYGSGNVLKHDIEQNLVALFVGNIVAADIEKAVVSGHRRTLAAVGRDPLLYFHSSDYCFYHIIHPFCN